MMTDQQRFDALSCHGGWIQTPNLDLLAAEGVDLLGHYAQSPVCVPSRCSLFSGRYAHAHGVLENDARLPEQEISLLEVLKREGYRVSYSGKNHLLDTSKMNGLVDRFDDFGSKPSGEGELSDYFAIAEASGRRLNTVGSYASAEFHDFPDEVTNTGRTANRALEYLQESPATGAPWCVIASFSDPHVPHLAPRRFESLYPLDKHVLPNFAPLEHDSKHPRVKVKWEVQGSANASDYDKRFYLSVYGSMCTYVDEQIGRIVEAVRCRPDADRTIIVFVSDHGDFGWHHGMCKKDLLLYDDLLHVPAILYYPAKLPSRRVSSTLSEHVDIVPTLLELAGIDSPSACHGKSLVPLLSGANEVHKESVYAEVCYPWMRSGHHSADDYRRARAKAKEEGLPLANSAPYNVPGDYTKCVRTKELKYIWYADGFEELYDLSKDPEEKVNRSK